ncbi:MAG: tryptophan--tRNA ligase, partial [Candidatus Omnitrophica bacterium]|nr:tryptophan--tRNA ligase [Candidatus Omnitrophota bacterium]
MKKRVFSGIKPSGDIHLGNYLGAIRNWVTAQEEHDSIYCIVDLHSITVPQNPKELKRNIRELTAIYFAAGIDEKKSTVFVQSHVSAHSELAWILNCFIPMGWMERMTQFKDKAQKNKKRVSVGLFDYPALMAADILLYDTDYVPVGEDQKQHVELTRDTAELMNSRFGKDLFKVPAPVIPKTGARIMGLDDPQKKMAKSDDKSNRSIYLLDSPDTIRKKIMRATTDSLTEIRFDKDRHGVNNLLTIYQLCSGKTAKEIEAHFAGKQYSDLKRELAEVVVEELRPVQEKAKDLLNHPDHLES